MPTKSSPRASELPDEFFTAIAFLVPYLNRVAQTECGMNIGSLLVMMHLTISGKEIDERRTMLRRDLTKVLQERGFSEARISRLLQDLEFGGFVQRMSVPPALRETLFEPSERANTLAIALTPAGEEKIREFKKALRRHFGNWLSKASKDQPWVGRWLSRLLLPRAVKLAESVIERIAEVGP